MKKCKRKKASWGSVINAGVSGLFDIIGSISKANTQRVATDNMFLAQKRLLEKQDILNRYNQKLETQLTDQENQQLYDELRRKNYKCGGKLKVRKRAEWGVGDTGSLLGSLISGVTGIIGSGIMNSANNYTMSKQIQLNDMKFKSDNVQTRNLPNTFAERMRKYLNGEENDTDITNEITNKRKNIFANKQFYLQ